MIFVKPSSPELLEPRDRDEEDDEEEEDASVLKIFTAEEENPQELELDDGEVEEEGVELGVLADDTGLIG